MDVHTIHTCPFLFAQNTQEEKKMPEPEATGTPPAESPTLGQEPVVEGQQPTESPTLPETPSEPSESEMSPEDKILHKMQSWWGRREAELKQEMTKREQAMLEAVRGLQPQSAASVEEAPDPTMDADAWFEHKLQQRVKREQDFNEKLIRAGTAMVQQDELVKANPKLADEVYEEVRSGRVQINRNLPPEQAARVAVIEAKANILSRQILTKPNPLAGNTGITEPVGGIKPPPPKPKATPKMPEMSDYAKAYAEKMGMTPEQVAEALKE
jgi:hypothetical protein